MAARVYFSNALGILIATTSGLLLLAAGASSAQAGTSEAMAAYQRGDLATGLKELEAGVASEEPSAFYNLGITYKQGVGVPVDSKKAASYFLQGAERGNLYAAFEIAECYFNGKVIGQDFKEAARWYRFAATRGHYQASIRLGSLYFVGAGVSPDLVEAFAWIYPAASEPIMDEAAGQYGLTMIAKMTKAQVRQAVERGKQYQQAYTVPNMAVVNTLLAASTPR